MSSKAWENKFQFAVARCETKCNKEEKEVKESEASVTRENGIGSTKNMKPRNSCI